MGKINSKNQQDLSPFLLVTELNWMWRSYQNKLGVFLLILHLVAIYSKEPLGEEKNKKESLQNQSLLKLAGLLAYFCEK